MDRRVKERLVGASILLVLIVLVVPELLSGPAPPPAAAPQLPAVSPPKQVRRVTVDLATSKPLETAAPSNTAEDAPPPPAAPSSDTPAEPPVVTTPADTSDPAGAPPLEAAATPPISTASTKSATAGRGWAVQLGSFASRANADKLVHQVKAQGFAVFVSASGAGTAERYRVRVGPAADRSGAMQLAAKLKSVGHNGSLVPP